MPPTRRLRFSVLLSESCWTENEAMEVNNGVILLARYVGAIPRHGSKQGNFQVFSDILGRPE